MATKPRLMHDFENLKNDTSRVVADLGKLSASISQATRETSSEVATEFTQRISHEMASLREKMRRLEEIVQMRAKEVDAHVREHPYLYVMAATGFGLLVAKFITRRRS